MSTKIPLFSLADRPTQDTLHLATGCQDGLVRVYDTMQCSADPAMYPIATKSSEAPTKVIFSGDDNFVMAGTRVGTVQLLDRRLDVNAAAVHSAALSSNKDAIMDIELSANRDSVLVTVGKKVLSSFHSPALKRANLPSQI
jgi:WD40 repeat protein